MVKVRFHPRQMADHDTTAIPLEGAATTPRLRLEERHSLALRWMHWINFPLLLIMIWSGLMLYWVTAVDNGVLDHQRYRVGVGPFTLFRLFPDWFYRIFKLNNHLTRGHAFHSLAMWPFVINGVAYVLFLAFSGQWRVIVPSLADIKGALPAVWQAMLKKDVLLPGEKYNGAQRFAYTAVLLIGAGSVLSGIAIWKPTSLPHMTALMGGYETARWIHFWCTMAFCGFIFIHVLQVLRAGWSTMKSMVTGFEVVTEQAPMEPESVHGD
jgi:thiosulfate reductase cytochrome b subunit